MKFKIHAFGDSYVEDNNGKRVYHGKDEVLAQLHDHNRKSETTDGAKHKEQLIEVDGFQKFGLNPGAMVTYETALRLCAEVDKYFNIGKRDGHIR